MENETIKNDIESRKKTLKDKHLPVHVAIIMDGNGRWAKKRNLSRVDGHKAGIDTVRKIVKFAGEIDIKYLTLYTFSSENWSRPPLEVMGIMKLLAETVEKEVPELHKNRVRLKTIGDISLLPAKSRNALNKAIELTSGNNGLTLILALNYGGRNEIVGAIKTIAEKVAEGVYKPKDINSEIFEKHLETKGFPDPDLLIRTSGERRLSNFLLWQLAYTELWISDVLWPDFSESDFLDALDSYTKRERRFGMTSQQISTIKKKVTGIFKGKND